MQNISKDTNPLCQNVRSRPKICCDHKNQTFAVVTSRFR